MQKTRIGFIGAGGIAQRHLSILENFDDVVLAAFADTDFERAEVAARRHGAQAFENHTEMLASTRLDAVFICIPPYAHGVPEQDVLSYRLPFFVEKPLSLDLGLSERIAQEIACKRLVTAVGYHWRYLDTVEEARHLLTDNPAQLLSGFWLDQTPPPQWWWRKDRSGGQMIEQATHIVDLARYLAGNVTKVFGMAGHCARPDFEHLDVATASTASLRFASGAIADISATCLLRWGHRIGLHIFADGLAIELTDHDIMVDVGAGRPVRRAEGDPVWYQDRDFVDAVRGGENRIRCPYQEALETHRVAVAIARSAETGMPISLEPTCLRRSMASHRTIHSLGFEKPNEPYFFAYVEGPPSDGEVRLETLYSGFSAGTELTFLKNTNPYLHSRWDEEIGVFVEGEPSAHYPMPFLGYMEVARVSDSHTQRFVAGDIVAATYAHKSGHTANPALDVLIPMPVGLDPILGVFVAQMGPIAANGVLHADVEIYGENVPYLGAGAAGRPVAIWGCGTVGFLSALFARKAGAAEVLIAEPSPFRRKIAENLGFLALPEEQAWRYAKERWQNGGSDRGADFVFQTRPQANSLHLALRALRPQGTVIDLAFYQGGADGLRLGEEFHHNGLNLKCAQISRVPRGLGYSWDRRRLAQETIALLQSDREAIGRQLITHVVPFSDAPAFLKDLVRTRPDFVQIVFAADQ